MDSFPDAPQYFHFMVFRRSSEYGAAPGQYPRRIAAFFSIARRFCAPASPPRLRMPAGDTRLSSVARKRMIRAGGAAAQMADDPAQSCPATARHASAAWNSCSIPAFPSWRLRVGRNCTDLTCCGGSRRRESASVLLHGDARGTVCVRAVQPDERPRRMPRTAEHL